MNADHLAWVAERWGHLSPEDQRRIVAFIQFVDAIFPAEKDLLVWECLDEMLKVPTEGGSLETSLQNLAEVGCLYFLHGYV